MPEKKDYPRLPSVDSSIVREKKGKNKRQSSLEPMKKQKSLKNEVLTPIH